MSQTRNFGKYLSMLSEETAGRSSDVSTTSSVAWQRAEAERRAQAAQAVNAPAAPYNAAEEALIRQICSMVPSRHRSALIWLLIVQYRYRLGQHDTTLAHVKAAQADVNNTAGQGVIAW